MSPKRRCFVVLLLLAPFLLASDCGGFNEDDFSSTTGPSPFISLVTSGDSTSLPADGVSRLLLIARISPDSSQRTIQFTTTAGALIGGAPNTGTTAEVATVGGEATVELQSSQQTVTARVTAVVKNEETVSASLEINFVSSDTDSLITFTQAPSSAPADGSTASFFEVRISSLIPDAERTVQFETTAGSFDAANADTRTLSVQLGAATTASVPLYSPKVVVPSAQLRARVQNTTISRSIRFARALPNAMTIQLDKFQVRNTAADHLDVTVNLLRDVGTVSDGTVVTFQAIDIMETVFGIVSGSQTSTDGTTTIEFSPAGGATVGAATLTVGVQGSNVSESIAFEVIAP